MKFSNYKSEECDGEVIENTFYEVIKENVPILGKQLLIWVKEAYRTPKDPENKLPRDITVKILKTQTEGKVLWEREIVGIFKFQQLKQRSLK